MKKKYLYCLDIATEISILLNKKCFRIFVIKVSKYTREAGVRGLERKLGALCRAAAVHIANNKAKGTSHVNGKENTEASTISKQNDNVAVREV